MSALPPGVSALERRLGLDEGSLVGAERARADEALADATALALAEVAPHTAAAWQTSAPAVVATVILKAARREFENPQGLRSENLGEHGFSVAVASGAYLTPREIMLIQQAALGRSGFTGSIRTPSAYDSPAAEGTILGTL